MLQPAHFARPTSRLAAVLFVLALGARVVSAQTETVPGIATVRGSVYDSVHSAPLVGAIVDLEPLGREARTNEFGEFRFDSVLAQGNFQIRILHPMLDTAGVRLVSPAFTLKAGETRVWNLSLPSSVRLVSIFCAAPQLALGPSALVGFVRDPDTGAPIDSVTVSLVYEDQMFGLAKRAVKRETKPDAGGRYKICGLPTSLVGHVQLLRGTTMSADIPVQTDANDPLALRSLGMSLATQHVDVGKDSTGRTIRILKGNAHLSGRVLTKSGLPISGARVQMDATRAAAVTKADGRFALDSLPTGTQTLIVRKLGYSVTDMAVDVSSVTPANVTVMLADYIPTLSTVVTVAQRDQDLQKVGFTRRKASGAGYYREGAQIDGALNLVDMLSQLPGLRSNQGTLASARGIDACVTILVDGVLWIDAPDNGSIQDYVRPEEVQAIELYSQNNVPSDFAIPAFTNCQVLAIWTQRKIRPGKTTKPPAP